MYGTVQFNGTLPIEYSTTFSHIAKLEEEEGVEVTFRTNSVLEYENAKWRWNVKFNWGKQQEHKYNKHLKVWEHVPKISR